MAELKAGGALREQLAAVAAMRWRTYRNRLRLRGGVLELGAQIVLAAWTLSLAGGGGVAAFFIAWFAAAHGRPTWLAVEFWIIFLFWQLFPLLMAASGQVIDAASLLRYPLSYGGYVTVRCGNTLADPAVVIAGVLAAAATLGPIAAAPETAPLALAAGLGFALFNLVLGLALLAWCERWLARRRSREIAAVLFFVLILAAQLVMPIGAHHHVRWRAALKPAYRWLRWLPPSLAAQAMAPARGAWRAAGSWLLLLAWSLPLIAALHARLRAEFRGEWVGEGVAAPKAVHRRPAAGWLLPGVAGAVASNEFRFVRRTPVLWVRLLAPAAVVLLFAASRSQSNFFARAAWVVPLAAVYALVASVQFVYNCFASDGAGVVNYFTLPVEMRAVMLGKNLAHAALMVLSAALACGIAVGFFGPPPLAVAAATVFGVVCVAVTSAMVGNVFSVLSPQPFVPTLRRQRGVSAWGSLVSVVIVGAAACACGLAFALGRAVGNAALAASLVGVCCAAALSAYRGALRAAAVTAFRHREVLIEQLSRIPG